MDKKIFVWGLCCSSLVLAQERAYLVQIKPSNAFNVTKDDMAHLRQLANGVGWDMEPNDETTAGLKKIGIRRIRCTNVDPLPGKFDEKGDFTIDRHPKGYNYYDRLNSELAVCRAVGATPHIILATGLHEDLVLKIEDLKKKGENILGLSTGSTATYGPKDWKRLRNYYKRFFEYVLIDQKFAGACFEVSNEPDTGGSLFVEHPPKPQPGTRALYEAFLKIYGNVALAATEFEGEHSGVPVTLGGPAITWAYTFRFGDFNWIERFLRDARQQKLKLDFIGLHYYGNLSALTGESPYSCYPSFSVMIGKTREWRDKYMPDVPIWFTEWGATYCTSLDPQSLHNGNHVGAAFAAAFLNQMLVEGVDRAIYLVTTDARQQTNGKWEDVWGWPALFTTPNVLGVHPKAPYHIFQMISRMAPKRIEAMNPGGRVGCIASKDDKGRLTVLVWNHSYRITEGGPGTELGQEEHLSLRILEADEVFKGPVKVERYLVSKTVSNAFYLFEKGQKIDGRAELQKVEESTIRPVDGALYYGFTQPPSSVSFIEFGLEAKDR